MIVYGGKDNLKTPKGTEVVTVSRFCEILEKGELL